jgi:hypothetical protein
MNVMRSLFTQRVPFFQVPDGSVNRVFFFHPMPWASRLIEMTILDAAGGFDD